MVEISGPPRDVIRNKDISSRLRVVLDLAGRDCGIDKIKIVSGGQVPNHTSATKGKVGGWKGSHRHDNGGAADIRLYRGGNLLTFTDDDGSDVAAFVTAAAKYGATGIGAGVTYMGNATIHVGFGNSPYDKARLVWGAQGRAVNAPQWLVTAARRGWEASVAMDDAAVLASLGLPKLDTNMFSVQARDGLWLRKGPGLAFERSKLLDPNTRLHVLGFDGEWAKVDLKGDGLLDGHVHSAFIADEKRRPPLLDLDHPDIIEQEETDDSGANNVGQDDAGDAPPAPAPAPTSRKQK